MVGMINKILKAAIIAVAGMASIVGPAFSQQALTSTGERYIPTIWVGSGWVRTLGYGRWRRRVYEPPFNARWITCV